MSTDPKKNQTLSVLAVDDSAVYRKIIKEVMEEISGVELLGAAFNGRMALEKIRTLHPDMVLLDVEMPEMNGLQTLEIIRKEFPEIGVVMISGMEKWAADITVAALEMGALDFITKPDSASPEANHKTLVERLSPILWNFSTKKMLESVRRKCPVQNEGTADDASIKESKERNLPTPEPGPAVFPSAYKPPALSSIAMTGIHIIAIGVSTGGPNALGVIIPSLPNDIGVPILIVQHMPPLFTASLAKSLERKSRLPVSEAFEGQIIEPNAVYIAPGGKHMVVRRENDGGRFTIGLNKNPPENACRPAVDVLFRSVAAVYGNNVLAVIMTGMGQDGLNGVKALKQRGCYCLAQDEATSMIYGMPMAVFKAGLADESVPLQDLAGRMTYIAKYISNRR